MRQYGDTDTRRDGEEPQASRKLLAALKEPPLRRVFVPPTVDDAVLKIARQHLVRPKRVGFGALRTWLAWPAFAAACLVLIGWLYFALRPVNSIATLAREDLNHDGRVDILDAFQLARELHSGVQPASGLDLNGDGRVDQADVEHIAAQAVKLGKGGES